MSWILDKVFKKGRQKAREIFSGLIKNTPRHKRFPKKETANGLEVDLVRMKVAKNREEELIERGF